MTTLDSPALAGILKRLYAAAENDPTAIATARAAMTASGGKPDDRTRAALMRQAYLPVAPAVGRLFYLLTRARQPKLVVEFGTSYGISTLHFAAALRDNGAGRVMATEIDPEKARHAAATIAEAGLGDLLEMRQGDAFETLARDAEPIDLLFLDAWKDAYLRLIKLVEPRLAKGALIVADDTKGRPELEPYLAYVRDPANGYVSAAIPIDDGLELSIRA